MERTKFVLPVKYSGRLGICRFPFRIQEYLLKCMSKNDVTNESEGVPFRHASSTLITN